MKTRRGQRYEILRANGFLPGEARPLSRVPIKTVPYMKPFIRERRGLFADAMRQKVTIAQYRAAVNAIYHKNRFLKRNKVGRFVPDPWALLHDFEDRYRSKNPAYESPWEKRRRSWGDFLARIEKTIAAQNRLREKTA